MQADFVVELGAEDPTLELPWSDPDSQVCYYDLRNRPDLLLCVDEAVRNRELGEFLAAVNSPRSSIQSAKCDVWLTRDLSEEESGFGAPIKFGCYVDLVFADQERRFSLGEHEVWGRRWEKLLHRAPEMPAATELILRRCFFHEQDETAPRQGFYYTLYCFGYGDDESDARQRWNIALKLVQNAVRQMSVGAVEPA